MCVYACVCVCVCTCHIENMCRREERAAASIQDGGSSSLTDCTAMLSQFIAVIPYFFWHFQLCLSHMAGFFFFPFYTYLITLLCFSLALPPSYSVPPPLFHFLFKWSLPHCFVCRVFSYVGGQVAQGSYYSLALWRMEWAGDGGVERGTGQPRSGKDAVRYVKDSCSIYLVILRGTSQGEVHKNR